MKIKTFNKMPRLTNAEHYDITDVLWRLDSWSDSKLYTLDLDPDFQRAHVWTETQQIAFIEFLAQGGQTHPILFNRCDGQITLVDGKQRLTAILKFLANDLKIFGQYVAADFDDLFTMKVLFQYAELTDKNAVIDWYIAMNTGGSVHTEEDIELAKSCKTAQ